MDDEIRKVIWYSKKYDGAFYRSLANALEVADSCDAARIKECWADWWKRCLSNYEILEQRGLTG